MSAASWARTIAEMCIRDRADVLDAGVERVAHGLAGAVDQLVLAIQRHHRQPGLDEVARAVVALSLIHI